MPVRYQLDLIVNETGEKASVAGEFSDEETGLLLSFTHSAEQVWRTEFMRGEEKGRFSIKWDHESGGTISTVLPEWDKVMVFLHKFRPLLLQNEGTNFYKIHNLLAKKLDHPYFRSSLGLQHELYSGKASQALLQITSNDVLLNSERVLFDWLNSHEYHRDEEKRKFIESLHQILPLEASKVIFLRLLINKAVAAINLTSIILVVLGKQKKLGLRMKRPHS